jgi:hypothetical protein
MHCSRVGFPPPPLKPGRIRFTVDSAGIFDRAFAKPPEQNVSRRFSIGVVRISLPALKISPFESITYLAQSPMNWPTRTSALGRPDPARGNGSHVVPVLDVQWGRPVFRPPALPAHPRLFNTVPFTAMRPLRPTSREKHELSY